MLSSVLLILNRDSVIRRVTSKSLGSLAPGYAATPRGYSVYAGLVADLGVIVASLDLATKTVAGIYLLLAAIAVFIAGTVAVIVGEVVTYRALTRGNKR